MDIVTGQGGDVTRAEIIMPMSSKTCSMKHWARRTITKKQESINNDGVVLGIQVKGCYEIHKLDVEQYVNDNMMLSLVNSDSASDTIIKTYLGPRTISTHLPRNFRLQARSDDMSCVNGRVVVYPADSYVREFDSDIAET